MPSITFPPDLDWQTLATTDPVTGLYNRLAVQLAMNSKSPYMLFVMDLNKFKPINDTAGHEAGDKILRAIACSIRKERSNDLVARWGGDEFVVLIECSAADAPGIYHRLKAAVLSTSLDEWLPIAMHGHRCGVAIGYAASEEPEAFALADARMYRDKEG